MHITTHGTAVDAVQLATPKTPTASALEPLPNTDFRLLVQDWYKGASTVVTNISLSLSVDNNTTVRVVRIMFPATATFTPLEAPMAGGRITIQLAGCMPRGIILQIQDGQGPSPQRRPKGRRF